MKRNPFFKIQIFTNLAEKEMERKLLNELGISFSQSMILDFIHNNPEISQREVAMERHITPAAVSRHIEVLEELGFIKRRDREDNKREHILIITKEGQNVALNAERLLEESMNGLIENISNDEIENIEAIFNRLLGRFE